MGQACQNIKAEIKNAMSGAFEKISKQLPLLNDKEKSWLIRELLSSQWLNENDKSKELAACEQWLFNWRENAARESRNRVLLIFMLLRYGALRYSEIISLKKEDLDLQAALLHVSGRYARVVPIPFMAAQRMLIPLHENIWNPYRDNLLYCDPSQLRRSFSGCAQKLGFSPKFLSISNLRSLRCNELEREGIHQDLIKYFLYGSYNNIMKFRHPDQLLQNLIQKPEIKIRTSARNSFNGKIIEIKPEGILVKVTIETQDKLRVTAIITQTSKKNLELTLNKNVVAIVKAPMVKIYQQEKPENCYKCTIEKIYKDNDHMEILAALPQGTQFCSVYANGYRPPMNIRNGDHIWIGFDAYSVIITD